MICFKNVIEFSGCELKVEDYTKYPCDTGIVEFVTYVKDGVQTVSNKSIRISTKPNSCSYVFQPEEDGRYMYYKVALPIFSDFDKESETVEVPYGYFIGVLGCEKIICINEKNSVSLSNNGDSISVTKVTDLMLMINSGLVEDIFTKEFFSICELNACVAKRQKKYLLDHADDCGNTKCKKGSDSDKAGRDFLFIASYLIEHYIEIEDFDQAEELLNTVMTNCGNSLCNSDANTNCGCNG